MNARLYGYALIVVCLFGQQTMAQQWLGQLPPDQREQPTIDNLKQAFESYYREHPIDLKEKEHPIDLKEKERPDVEEYMLFQRWEWLVTPRAYPSGRLDLEQIAAYRADVRNIDEQLTAEQPPSPLKSLRSAKVWKPLGPSDAVGGTYMGRVNCIEFDPSNKKTIYLCSADGGVWKSTNGGATWSPKFDSEQTLSVGDIAIDPKNTNHLYVATSDPFGYGHPFWGGTYSVGVMESTNGGNAWSPTGLHWDVSQLRTIRRLAMHPSNPKILMAATSDGLYRTANGGQKWHKILPASTYDVEFQQNDGSIAYATTNQVLKSTNAGESFDPLDASCDDARRYNIKIALGNPKVLYTLCTRRTGDGKGIVQKSSNSGAKWDDPVTLPDDVNLYGYYDNILAVSPINKNVVYVAGMNITRTTNGGRTWSAVPLAGHYDNHVIKFARSSSSTIYSGNDGGIFKTTNSGATWTSLNKGLAITQFYRLGVSRTIPSIMIAGAQDNGVLKYTAGVFANLIGKDGMQGFIDWSNSRVIYAAIHYGDFNRSTNGGTRFDPVNTPAPGAWLAPWCQDPVTAPTLYAATDKVYKSVNRGTKWTPISGDLDGIGKDSNGRGTFTVLKVAPSDPKVIYAGSQTRLYRTTSGGGESPGDWNDITAGLPVKKSYLTALAISDTNPDIVYATFSGYEHGEKVYRTMNGGSSWENFSGKLPNMPVDAIVYRKNENNAVYIGTDAGVYYRNDTLLDWVRYKAGLPNVIVDDLQIDYKTKTIRAATYGRGLWWAPLR